MPIIPADVPTSMHQQFMDNYKTITKNKNRLMLFSVDQKMEHLNRDFYGPFISPESNNPENFLKIASQGKIGALATHFGIISRYGNSYKDINYIVKLNGKTNLVPTDQKEPISKQLWSVEDIVEFKKNSGLKICGVGYTIYLGSEFESEMLTQAAQIVNQAHRNGLIAILWIYPRGKSITGRLDIDLAPGSTGIANSLGADFVKIKPPKKTDSLSSNEILKIATQASGNTKVICSGGKLKNIDEFLNDLYEQIHLSGTSGNATGRNIFQRTLKDAIAFTNAISAITYDDATVEEALKIYNSML